MGYTDYIDFITLNDMTAPIMKGKDIYNRPFISIRYIDNISNSKSVVTFFQRYTNEYHTWAIGSRYRSMFYHVTDEEELDCLKRLLKKEPCGKRNQFDEEIIKLTNDGRSIIEII